MSEIMCYNHECRQNLDWCCLNHRECINPDNCEWRKEWIEHCKWIEHCREASGVNNE